MRRPSGSEQQRRQATVIFADISGFTAMSEKLDPEDVTDIMDGCFRMLERIIRRRGGTVDKYIGDCVMALFGAEHAIESSAAQAVHAALEMRSGLQRYNDERRLPVPLRIHIGVNTGLVIAGEVGGDVKRDFTVMGDTVNLAARLEDASDKGQIFVGPETHSATRDQFDWRRLEPLSLKGKTDPVQAYEVLGLRERATVPRLGAATRHIEAELVGREAELAALRDAVSALLAGRGGIVNVSGEAGLGKSRLLYEIARSKDLERATILAGRSQSVGARASYHSFAEILKEWAGISEGDAEAEALSKIERRLEALSSLPSREVLPFLAILIGLPTQAQHAERLAGIEGDALERLITKAMTDLITAMAAESPVLLCFEDLHWADMSTIKLLESLLHLAAEQPVLFLSAFRPRFADTSDRVAAAARDRHASCTVDVSLQPLPAREADTLVRRLLRIDDISACVRDLIATRAEGNPFYIEEVIRALIDRGVIEQRGEGLAITDRIDEIQLPGTIQEVIAVRIEQLDERAVRLLEMAAVIGRSFYHRIIEALAPEDVDVEAVLAELKERQIVSERRARRTGSVRRRMLATEREYVFQHALIQETIYAGLLHRTRRRLHLRVAESVERTFGDRLAAFYGMLALHYMRGEDLERAEGYLLRAGDEAVRAAASSEALHYFQEAYRIYPLLHGNGGDPVKRTRIETNLGYALLLTGKLAEARPYFDRALEFLGERLPRSPRAARWRLLKDLAWIFYRLYLRGGRMPRRAATPRLSEALTLLYNRARAESITDPDRFFSDSVYAISRLTSVDPHTVEHAFAQYAGGGLLFAYSGLSFGLSHRFKAVARSLLREDRPSDLFTYELMTAMCNYFEGNWDRVPEVDDSLLENTLKTGQLWDVDTFLGIEAEWALDRGEIAAAERRLRRIQQLIDEYGYRFSETNRDALRVFIALQRRELGAALEAVEIYAEHPVGMLKLIALGTRIKILVLRGDLSEAEATLERAEQLVSRLTRPTSFHSGALRTGALLLDAAQLEIARESGDRRLGEKILARTRRHGAEARRTARSMARVRTETYRSLGTLAWLQQHLPCAEWWWERSLAEGTRLGARPELARTHLEIGRRAATGGKPTRVAGLDADAHLERAASLFGTMGFARELAQAEEARAGRPAA